MAKDNYFDNRAEKNTIKIREIVETFPPFANEFFIGMRNRTSELTRLNYAYDLRIFFDYLCSMKFKNALEVSELTLRDLETVTAFDIELFLDYLSSYTFGEKHYKCGEAAKERKLSTLRSFFKYYFNKDKLSSNVTTKVELPKKHEKAIIRLEPDEVVKLLNEAENASDMSKKQRDFHNQTKIRDVAILTLFLGTGIRISELVGLNRDDIDLNTNSFTVTRKGGNKAILYFSDEVASALADYYAWLDCQKEDNAEFYYKIKNHDALFLSIQGNRISTRAVELLVKKYSRLISPLKKITPHKLRSTYGTELYRETQDIYVVADVLGHKDVNTTKKHYAAMSEETRKKAASAVKLRSDS